jgi:hypothetical protein
LSPRLRLIAFSIRFEDVPLEYPYEDPATAAAMGVIVLGSYCEEFLASLAEWTVEEYRNHWRSSILQILRGADRAVLITTFGSPTIASHLEWWALYRVDKNVFSQNQLVFYADIAGVFDVSQAVKFLKERRTKTDEGAPISEWNVSP